MIHCTDKPELFMGLSCDEVRALYQACELAAEARELSVESKALLRRLGEKFAELIQMVDMVRG